MLGATLAGCAHTEPATTPANPENADKFLFDHGQEALSQKHWLEARQYFQRLVDSYPTSPYRQDAKLGIGDSYLDENHIDSNVLAAGEFREFLRFYPLADKADYAHYRLAEALSRQVLGPQRDQTATHQTLDELNTFVKNYPNSKYLPEALKMQRQMQDLLSESEFLVGRQYYRMHWYPGAVSRLQGIMKSDPDFTRRDEVYFYLAESFYKQNKKDEAIPLYQKLIDEFKVSDYLDEAKQRLHELEPQPDHRVADADVKR